MQKHPFLRLPVKSILYCLVLVFALPACIIVVEEDPYDDDDYYKRRWWLEFIYYEEYRYAPASGESYTLTFAQDESLNGQADCLAFEGRYAVSGSDALSISALKANGDDLARVAIAGDACGGGSLASMYLEELTRAASISGDAAALTIRLDGANYMRFRAE